MKWFKGSGEPKPNKPMTIQEIEKLLSKRMAHTGDAIFLKIEGQDYAILSKDDYLKVQRIIAALGKLSKELHDE